MWISSIELKNFRCFKSLLFTASKDLNTLVGENNVGKTSVFVAVSKLIDIIWSTPEESFKLGDIRHNQLAVNPLSVACTFSLDANDKRDIVELFSPKDFDLPTKRILKQRLSNINILDTLQVGFNWSEKSSDINIKLGPLNVQKNKLTYKPNPSGHVVGLDEVTRSLVSSEYSKTLEMLMQGETMWGAANLTEEYYQAK